MGYDSDDSMVRVDFFKPSGKWYSTKALKWNSESELTTEAFRESLQRDETAKRLLGDGMFAVCLEPHHEHQFPLVLWSLDFVKNVELAKAQSILRESILGIPT